MFQYNVNVVAYPIPQKCRVVHPKEIKIVKGLCSSRCIKKKIGNNDEQ
jgi:hypothetical protein